MQLYVTNICCHKLCEFATFSLDWLVILIPWFCPILCSGDVSKCLVSVAVRFRPTSDISDCCSIIMYVVAQEIHIITRNHKLVCPTGFKSVLVYLRAWISKAMKHVVQVTLNGKRAYQIFGNIKNSAVEDKWNRKNWDFWYNANILGDSGRKVLILGGW